MIENRDQAAAWPQPEVRSQFVQTNKGPVDVLECGRGRPILYFHGTGAGNDVVPTMEYALVEAGFRLIVPNRPGYYGTPLSCGRTPDECADLAAEVLDRFGIERAAVIGTSGGGLNPDPFKSQAAVFNSTARRRNAQREPDDIFVTFGSVVDDPADPQATTTVFNGNAGLSATDNQYLFSRLTFLGGSQNPGQFRQITAYTGATREFTVGAAFVSVPENDDPFRIDAMGQAGTGASTFRTEDNSVLDFNTVRDPNGLISDFGTTIPLGPLPNPDISPYPFTWARNQVLPVPPFTP